MQLFPAAVLQSPGKSENKRINVYLNYSLKRITAQNNNMKHICAYICNYDIKNQFFKHKKYIIFALHLQVKKIHLKGRNPQKGERDIISFSTFEFQYTS